MYKKREKHYEKLCDERHAEFEVKDTRVSDYLRRYGTGHIEDLPTTSAPEVKDDRTEDEMLNSEFEPTMSTESVDILMEIERNKERFENAVAEIELTASQKKRFDDAVRVLNDDNASIDAKREAYSILQELEDTGKVTRARN